MSMIVYVKTRVTHHRTSEKKNSLEGRIHWQRSHRDWGTRHIQFWLQTWNRERLPFNAGIVPDAKICGRRCGDWTKFGNPTSEDTWLLDWSSPRVSSKFEHNSNPMILPATLYYVIPGPSWIKTPVARHTGFQGLLISDTANFRKMMRSLAVPCGRPRFMQG